MTMNDQFLHRLREQPSLGFATALKAKLDLRAAAAATRKRFLYLMSSLVIGGAALAFVSPSVRQYVATLGSEPTSVQPSTRAPVERPATMSSDVAPQLATPLEEKAEAPQSKNEERTNVMTAAPSVIETRQAIGYSDLTANAQRAALIRKHAQSLNADIAALPADSRMRVDGASATLAILKAVGEEFEVLTHEKSRVSTMRAGIRDGFKKLCRGDIDIYGASRPILKQEMKDCSTLGAQFIELPIAYEAMAVIVNSNANWISEITTSELKKVWEPAAQGRVVKWDQVNESWPNQPLQLLGSLPNLPAHDYFTDAIIGTPKATRGDYIGNHSENAVTSGVGQYAGAMGYVHYTSDIVPASQVKALKIVNSAGAAVSPSESAIVDASYHPLSRPLLIYVNAEHAKRPEIQAFVKFLLTQGAKSIRKTNGVPLPDDMYESVLKKFANGKAGTVFDGQSAIGVQLDEALAREPVQ
jgi:phosphate transport system substrate-binding protein